MFETRISRFEGDIGRRVVAYRDLDEAGDEEDDPQADHPGNGQLIKPGHGEQEGSSYNGHFGCTCYHPLFCFNQFGDCEGAMLRPGNVHSADRWKELLDPIVKRYENKKVRLALPTKIKHWSLRSLLVKLIKIGAKVVRSGRYTTFKMAEVVVSKDVFAEILARISRLRCCPA